MSLTVFASGVTRYVLGEPEERPPPLDGREPVNKPPLPLVHALALLIASSRQAEGAAPPQQGRPFTSTLSDLAQDPSVTSTPSQLSTASAIWMPFQQAGISRMCAGHDVVSTGASKFSKKNVNSLRAFDWLSR